MTDTYYNYSIYTHLLGYVWYVWYELCYQCICMICVWLCVCVLIHHWHSLTMYIYVWLGTFENWKEKDMSTHVNPYPAVLFTARSMFTFVCRVWLHKANTTTPCSPSTISFQWEKKLKTWHWIGAIHSNIFQIFLWGFEVERSVDWTHRVGVQRVWWVRWWEGQQAAWTKNCCRATNFQETEKAAIQSMPLQLLTLQPHALSEPDSDDSISDSWPS